jgi:hypothetical protein
MQLPRLGKGRFLRFIKLVLSELTPKAGIKILLHGKMLATKFKSLQFN